MGRDAERPRSARAAVALVAGVSVVASAAAALVVEFQARDVERLRFAERATVLHSALQRRAEGAEWALASFGAFYAASDHVTEDEFTTYGRRVGRNRPELRAFEWVPRVPAEEAEAHEASARAAGWSRYTVFETASDGGPRAVTRGGDRFPVRFVEPVEDNRSAVGFDLGSEPVRRAALERARDTGLPVATRPVPLVRTEAGERDGVLLMLPRYRTEVPPREVEGRRQEFDGLLVVVLDLARLFESAHGGLPTEEVRSVLAHRVEAHEAPAWHRADLRLADQRISVEYRPAPGFGGRHRSRQAWLVFLVGCLFGGGVAWHARQTSAAASRFQRSAAEQARLNVALEREVEDRRRAEEEVRRLNLVLEGKVQDRTQELEQREGELAQAEGVLAGTRARLGLLLEHFEGAIWVLDDADRLRVATGAAAGELFANPAAAVGRTLLEAAADPELGARLDRAQRAADGGEPAELRLDEHTLELRVRRPEAEAGTRITLALDVTFRRRLEAERLAKQRGDRQRLESLGLLAGGIAHDFNNLLAAMVGNAGRAALLEPRPEGLTECLEEIELAGRRAGELVQQLLAFAGRADARKQPLDLAGTVAEITRLMSAAVPKKVRLEQDFAVDGPRVAADPTQLRQVVMNLVTNAADAIGDREGTVRLTSRTMSLPADAPTAGWVGGPLPAGLYVELSVSDDGCGMDADTRRRMFEPFFSTKEAGHGLGLAAVLGIVSGHGGGLRIESESGRGTVVRLVLPATAEEERPVQVETPLVAAPAAGAGAAVLVVDDEPGVRNMAEGLLRSAGYRVEVAADGVEALELFEADPAAFDLVLLDAKMPRMGGFEVLEVLRSHRPDLPVLLSSGYAGPGAAEAAAADPALELLPKPYRARDLLRAVASTLGEKRREEAG